MLKTTCTLVKQVLCRVVEEAKNLKQGQKRYHCKRALWAPKRDCLACLRHRCLKDPQQKTTRQVYFFAGRAKDAPETFTAKVKRKLDSPEGRHVYSHRLATVEPVFANITHALGLRRFNQSTTFNSEGEFRWQI